jgi:type I restriction enzyme M protein
VELIDQGIKAKFVRLEEGGKYITYLHEQKRRNYENPEEKVQADTFLRLVLTYKYPPERIRQFVPVQMGSETKEADIIVYNDDALKSPLIVAECKKPDVTEMEFRRAVDQAFSYAVAEGAKYVWGTSRLKNEYYEVPVRKPKDPHHHSRRSTIRCRACRAIQVRVRRRYDEDRTKALPARIRQ